MVEHKPSERTFQYIANAFKCQFFEDQTFRGLNNL